MNSNHFLTQDVLSELFPPDEDVDLGLILNAEEDSRAIADPSLSQASASTSRRGAHQPRGEVAESPRGNGKAMGAGTRSTTTSGGKPSRTLRSERQGAVARKESSPRTRARGSRRTKSSRRPISGLPEFANGRVVAIVNQKGGVGKTTSTINLGAALAEEGAHVLLVDFDPQGALSVGLGLNPNELDTTVHNLLLDRSVELADVVRQTKVEGLDLIPSNIDLSAAEVVLVSEVAREQLLKSCLAPAKDIYNYILIDCPPSLGLLTVNALTASDAVIVPLECEYFALRGMALLMDTIAKVQERLNPDLRILGILATMLDARTIHGREVLSRVSDAFGDKLFKTVIHKTIKFAEAPVAGATILNYARTSQAAGEYRELAREELLRES